MYQLAEKRLSRLINSNQQKLLKGGLIGLEKEALRVGADGSIAQTPHPANLGSALTHPWITTDFSEALIELITPPSAVLSELLHFLRNTHAYVYSHIGEEILWGASMPCIVSAAKGIPIAEYGDSNAGFMKHVYRRGLGYRYGRVMQVIAGIHFNYSVNEALWPVLQAMEANSWPHQEFVSTSYFSMIRNLQRFGWLIPYLFGASPAVCMSYLGGQPTDMEAFDNSTYYYPYATSMRMGDIGYQNKKGLEAGFKACYHDLKSYIVSLTHAIETPCPKYEAIGVVVGGEYRQLNANILQIENEYYTTVRPKQAPINNEKPTLALRDRGVQYVELRSLDVNAYDPLGINEQQLRFLEAFMLLCLFQNSPSISSYESWEIDRNLSVTARKGRDPSLILQRQGRGIPLNVWAAELCDVMQGFSECLDADEAGSPYGDALQRQRESIEDAERTPASQVLAEMRENRESFHDFAKRLSIKHARYFKQIELPKDEATFFIETARKSAEKQRAMELADTLSFEQYLANYFAQS